MNDAPQKIRCAIYTRKSVEEGLDQDYNSLDAQRDSCLSYVKSQQWNGWVPIQKNYDDGGYSGANTDRPALKALLTDIKANKVDLVVVYKIDRLSRSLCDFADLFAVFDKHHVGFVSVTQQIDTSTSAGRMMLNILMTFAQYEREVIAERIRDKFAASRKKGIWMGGVVPFGYKVVNRKLEPDPVNADVVRWLFKRYTEIVSVRQLLVELLEKQKRDGIEYKASWKTTTLYKMLANPVYIGKVSYKGEIYEGEHDAIVDQKIWDETRRLMADNKPVKKPGAQPSFSAPLRGHLKCGHCGGALTPSFAWHAKRKYVYYVCSKDQKEAKQSCPIGRISATEIETVVAEQIGKVLQSDTFASLLGKKGIPARKVKETLGNLPSFWKWLYPGERARLIDLLVGEIIVSENGLDITLKTAGMKQLAEELDCDNY